MVSFSLQYCSTNLLLTSAASPGLEGHTEHHSHPPALPHSAMPYLLRAVTRMTRPPLVGREVGSVCT